MTAPPTIDPVPPEAPPVGSPMWEAWQREAHGRTFAWWWIYREAPRRDRVAADAAIAPEKP